MAIFTPILTPLEVHQWFELGDHPNDLTVNKLNTPIIVRPFVDKLAFVCNICGEASVLHGIIAAKTEVKRVCPGDWIITLRDPETKLQLGYDVISDKELKANYELAKNE